MRKSIKGFSLIEMLVVVLVFSVLSIVATQSLILSLRGSKKSESVNEVKSNVDYAISTMERLLRNTQSITLCSPTGGTQIDYLDGNNQPGRFRCVTSGSDSYIASGSGTTVRLTSNNVQVICNDAGFPPFQCPAPPAGVPPSIIINVKARHGALGAGVEGSEVTSTTKILLRTY